MVTPNVPLWKQVQNLENSAAELEHEKEIAAPVSSAPASAHAPAPDAPQNPPATVPAAPATAPSTSGPSLASEILSALSSALGVVGSAFAADPLVALIAGFASEGLGYVATAEANKGAANQMTDTDARALADKISAALATIQSPLPSPAAIEASS